ncbi:MAG: MerR family transcriptional regulator [Bacteroidetes bacterium]|nr:MerR family transcriptional regulator [Bacteroidota bacterium]
MNRFSIKDFENISGIKAHTIRIWEQRYNLLSPRRTDTNIRYYTHEELKKLLNISFLYTNGFKISKIADLSEDGIKKEVEKLTETETKEDEQINALVIAMIEMEELKFEKIISTNLLRHGFEKTMTSIIAPFLEKIGILWQTNAINPAQEHFISNLIRQKIVAAIDACPYNTNKHARKFLLYLPENELHELSLLFYAYLTKQKGHNTIYLGQSVPFEDLLSVAKLKKPEYIVSVITSQLKDISMKDYIENLSDTFEHSKIFLSGMQIATYDKNFPKNITTFKNPSEFLSLL